MVRNTLKALLLCFFSANLLLVNCGPPTVCAIPAFGLISDDYGIGDSHFKAFVGGTGIEMYW